MLRLIILLCSTQSPEMEPMCVERTKACYEKFIEISDEPAKRVATLCFQTYTENLENENQD